MNFLDAYVKSVEGQERVDMRGRRAHSVSSGLKCRRDQVWTWLDEPITNPPKFQNKMKMELGNAVESYVIANHFPGVNAEGYIFKKEWAQIRTGLEEPVLVNGFVDVMVAKSTGNGNYAYRLGEIKTKYGFGAEWFKMTKDPGADYMSQLGCYLKKSEQVGLTNEGFFWYYLISDNTFGEIVQIDCRYDKETDLIHAYRWRIRHNGNDVDEQPLKLSYKVGDTLQRFVDVEKHLEEGTLPGPDYTYKYAISYDSVRDEDVWTESKLKKAAIKGIINGDWQVRYSSYFDKQREVDKLSLDYTEDEMKILATEWKRRHPKSKLL